MSTQHVVFRRDDFALTAPMDRATTAGGDVVTIICEPTDTVGWVQDQMSAHDSVWLAVQHGGDVCWFALYGDAADGVDHAEMKTLGSHGLTRETTIAELFSTLHGHDAVHPGGGARALVAA